MFSKIIAAPDGFHAFCTDKPIAIGMWTELADNLGPLRATKEEADMDLVMMATVIKQTVVATTTETGQFAPLSTKSLTTLVSIAKLPRRGVYPWFCNVDNMIELRNELQRRTT